LAPLTGGLRSPEAYKLRCQLR